jgi:hypothetical protein
MLRPQMLEAVFVAGSVFVGLTAPAVKWEKLAAVSQREMSMGYEFISDVEADATADMRQGALPKQELGHHEKRKI